MRQGSTSISPIFDQTEYGYEEVLPFRYYRKRTDMILYAIQLAYSAVYNVTVRCAANQRSQLERLCRYITRPAIANERLERNRAGELKPKIQ